MTAIFDLSGRVAVVTGGGRGLGAHMATILAAAGASVVLLGRSVDQLTATVERIRKQHPAQVVAIAADVGDAASLEMAAALAVKRFGRIDILVNNAGVVTSDPLLETSDADWDRVIDTNLTGVWRAARAFAPAMIANGYGRIVSIGSVMSGRAAANRGPYAASKAGLVNLTRALAIELGPQGITANCICPSVIVTDLNRNQIAGSAADAYARLLERVPAGRWGEMQDLDGAVLLFASVASAYITGQALYIDGGLTAG